MTTTNLHLPKEIVWWQRPFPDCNFLLVNGEKSALIDTGFVGHAGDTAALARQHCDHVSLVVNTHWHSDHVGGNAVLQQSGAGIIASGIDGEALEQKSPECCAAEYLDQPVPRYSIDYRVSDDDQLLLGDTEWAPAGRWTAVTRPNRSTPRTRHRLCS